MRAAVNCTSVSAMRFSGLAKTIASVPILRNAALRPGVIMLSVLLFLFICLSFSYTRAEGDSGLPLADRVIAFVDDQAITLRELEGQYQSTTQASPHITRKEVLDTMINKVLILRAARKYRIEAPSQELIMRDYIDLKLRAFIRISERDIDRFYRDNIANFEGKEFEDVRDEIEEYLTEKELNERLKDLLLELRKSAYIRVFLQE